MMRANRHNTRYSLHSMQARPLRLPLQLVQLQPRLCTSMMLDTKTAATSMKQARQRLAAFKTPEGRKHQTLYVTAIAVEKQNRGTGIGSSLCSHVISKKHKRHKFLRYTSKDIPQVHVVQKVALQNGYQSLRGEVVSEGFYDGTTTEAFRYVLERSRHA